MIPAFNLFKHLCWVVLAALLQAVPATASTLQPNANGTVTDPATGLTWMRCAMGQAWTGSTCDGTASKYTFDQANTLAGTPFAGQSDWRLPNIRELQTIVDRSVSSPAIDSAAFPNTPSSKFWSSSPVLHTPNCTWDIGFDFGYNHNTNCGSSFSFAVRLVRGGQSFVSLLSITRPTSDYVDNGNDTVTHTPTNLMWRRCAEGKTWNGSICTGTANTYTFDEANALTGTPFAGQSDWRLPTEDELLSLVDYGTNFPAINISMFPLAVSPYYWSSSPLVSDSSFAWSVGFGNGTANNDGRNLGRYVRLVRGGRLVLSVSKSGSGSGTVTSAPAGINCGTTCSALFNTGTSVTLTATPDTGSTFTGWNGACSGTGICVVSMSAAQNVTATFAASVVAPACSLSANPTSITAGGSSTLTASCTPAATSYTWTGGTCAGTTAATCTVTPTSTTTYSVIGTNAGGAGAAASATVTVNACTYALDGNSAAVPATASTGSVSVTSSCAWTATSDASWLSITSGTSGSGNGTVAYTVAANTGTMQRIGTLTIAGKTFTVTQAAGSTVAAPVCSLSANPPSITSGGSSTLTATCSPSATSYIWTGGSCAGTSGSACTVKPTATTTYSVQGSNAGGTNQAVSATVTVATANTASYTVPGTLGNDVFVLTAGNSYYGGAGNDTFIISHNTLRGGVTAKIIDTEGDNIVQLVDGLTLTASAFYADAAELTLPTGAKVQILGASKFKYQVGANLLAGDTAAVLTYSQFVSSLGASLSGTLPASGTAGYVVPTGFTQAAAPVPAVAGNASTVPGTLDDDVLVPSGGNSYLGGGGSDAYIISPYTLSGAVTAKIIDSEGANVIQLVKGLTIASSSFFSNAVQLTLSNGASVQVLGSSGFGYQLGANAPAGVTASSLSYAQFAAALGASVPTGTSAVSGSANFVVP